MKNKKILLTAGFAAVMLSIAVAVVFSARESDAEKSGDILSSNLDLLGRSETPESGLVRNDTLLLFEAPVADLGKMRINQKKDVLFRFSNVCPMPVVITKILTNCGCTSVDWSKAPVMPGKESGITITFQAEQEGVFFKKIFIYHSADSSPVEIALKGKVVP